MRFGKRNIEVIPTLDKQGNFSQFYKQDITDILKDNHAMKSAGNQYVHDKSMKLKCRIPEVDFLKYGHIFFINGVIDEKALNKWLDSPEGEHCKVNTGGAKFV